ncbi:MAG: diguanylate cyclase [Phycisphaerae bacterium]|nr:diguanylate cyclase [Phycisphaerae bacterium]
MPDDMVRPFRDVSRLWQGLAALSLVVAALDAVMSWNTQTPTATATIALCAAIYEHWRWRRPVRLLHQRISEVRSGHASLEELISVGGELTGLSGDVQNVLRELREQRRELVVLEQEMRDRVASRTSALERQLMSVRIQASRDPLTGLHNRRTLDEALPQLFAKCRQEKQDLTILAIDVDRFKQLNDTLGHAAGDALLKSIGQILRSGVREGDVAIRTGGDEFIVLLPGCPLGPARALGGRLAGLVDGLARTLGTSHPPGLSVGAATLADLPARSNSQQLLIAADKDLYTIKSSRKRAA